jgi:hypothetical protein
MGYPERGRERSTYGVSPERTGNLSKPYISSARKLTKLTPKKRGPGCEHPSGVSPQSLPQTG